jgi:Holliday junction DNA helicase RuvA
MLSYIQGPIVFSNPGSITIAVGIPESRVGYEISVPQTADYVGAKKNEVLELFLYTHIREDAFQLYGFFSQTEKDLFLTLLSVNGIGPKSALAILSAIEPAHLVQAILHEDKATLQSLPGIGKKTAERLLVELRDKVEKQFRENPGSAQRSSASSKQDQLDPKYVIWNEARLALLSLGYREMDITRVLQGIKDDNDPVQMNSSGDLIKRALRKISNEMGRQ